MQIRRLDIKEQMPLELLLLADPCKEMIETYFARSECYIAEIGEQVVGVYVLLPTRPVTIELVNIAVREEEQGKGIGKQLIRHAIKVAKEKGCKTIEVGTGNSSIGQLALYQKCGFNMVSIEKDYFLKHYPETIYENGIQCRDMVRLSLDLQT